MEVFENILFKAFLLASRVLAYVLFCLPFEKRKKFWLRLIAAVAVQLLLDYEGLHPMDSIILSRLSDIASFFVMTLVLWFCFNEKYSSVLFACIAGRCMTYIAGYICSLLWIPLGASNTYISIVMYALIYAAIYFLFARRIKSEECAGINSKATIAFAFVVLVTTSVLTMVFSKESATNTVKVVVYIMVILVCFLTLCLQFGLLTESKMKKETEIIEQLRIKEKEQYQISQDTIKLIGIKHHDIKNMLENFKGKFSDAEVEEIKNSIESYNISVKTGNETLDTVLTEKFIACKNRNIRLECFANGEKLSFITDLDIYSLFLNALNNAMESAEKIEEEEKRIIWLRIYSREQLLFVNVKNYIAVAPVYAKNQTLVTTKADKRYHGFGLQSMKMIAEKYGGTLSVNTDDELFNLNLVFPIP